MSDARCARQRLLPEVGVEGQARLTASRALVPAGPGADVAVDYLERAGVGRAEVEAGLPDAFPHGAHLRYAAPLAVARGSWLALDHIRRVLAVR